MSKEGVDQCINWNSHYGPKGNEERESVGYPKIDGKVEEDAKETMAA